MAKERDEICWHRATIRRLELIVKGLQYELRVRDLRLAEKDQQIAQLQQQVEELKQQALPPSAEQQSTPPAFVKANLPARRRRKKPGRKKGHEPALRPPPRQIDHHQDVPRLD